jgi:hypothetical protein
MERHALQLSILAHARIRDQTLRDEGLRRKSSDATCGTIRARDESMRAETQNLAEDIKQSVRLLRRHL